jgi:hypothetical protein
VWEYIIETRRLWGYIIHVPYAIYGDDVQFDQRGHHEVRYSVQYLLKTAYVMMLPKRGCTHRCEDKWLLAHNERGRSLV